MRDLKAIGADLKVVDQGIINLIKTRMDLARQVGAFKEVHEDPIFRSEIEDQRISEIRKYAQSIGLNPHLAETIIYTVINEACKTQMILVQSRDKSHIVPEDPELRYAWLKRNLIALTEQVACSSDEEREVSYPATTASIHREDGRIIANAEKLDDNSLAIDLGCGKGHVAEVLSSHFDRVTGYDLSQHMISSATESRSNESVTFEQCDLDEGIPCKDSSVSMVVMGLGTASDLRSLPDFLGEINRVLQENGRFVLSFYNKEALMYGLPYSPWESGMSAFINTAENCLTVCHEGKEYRVHAMPYSAADVRGCMPSTLSVTSMTAYPTVASIVPKALLTGEVSKKSIEAIDDTLLSALQGSYLLVEGQKLEV